MQHTEQLNEVASALSKAQSLFKNIFKENTAKIKTKSGAEYSYSYADLASILEITREPLAKNNLCVTQSSNIIDGSLSITTMLIHSSGQYLKNVLQLPIVDTGNNAIQAIGSSITYGRRYELASMLGIAAEEDDDANAVPKSNNMAKPVSSVTPVVHKYVAPQPVINVDDQLISEEQGKALITLIKANGYDVQDLKEMILFDLNIDKLSGIKNNHLLAIKKAFANPKPVEK